MKPTLKNEKSQQEDWEKRFDEIIKKEFQYTDLSGNIGKAIWVKRNTDYDYGHIDNDFNNLKQFIFNERQRVIKEVREVVENKKQEHYWEGQDHTPPRALTNNEILDDLLQELTKLKEL